MAPNAQFNAALKIRSTTFGLAKVFSLAMLSMATLCTSLHAQQNQGQAPQKQIETLAVVNGKPITRHQIANECMRRFGEDVLEDIVNKMLVMDACKKNGIVITEQDVNNEIAKSAKKLGWSTERYIKTITENKKFTVDQMKNDHVWHSLAIRRLAAQKMQVSDSEIDERLEFEYGAKVQVRQIVVDSVQKAQQIHAQASANPELFEKLAKQFSLDQNTNALGGLLPPVRRNSRLPELENVAFNLAPGQVSNVFNVAEMFVILRCEQHFPAEELSPQQITFVRQTLSEDISKGKMRTAAIELFQQMQETAEIVNVMNDPKLSQQLPGVAARINGFNILKKEVSEECIARFGTNILDTEINRMLLMQALESNGVSVEQQDLNAEIARAAESIGHMNQDGSVNIDEWLAFKTNNDLSKVQLYIEDEVWPTVALKKLIASEVEVTQDDMQKGFEANFGAKVDVLAIVSNDNRSALKVWNLASANPSAEYFGKLANQYSIEPASRNNFGVVPPIRKHTAQPELEKEAFGLQRGEISSVIQVGKHWLVLYCMGRTEPVVTDFDVVKEEIYKDILEKKMRLAMGSEFQRLREESQIDNFLSGTSQPGKAAVRSARQTNGTQGAVPFGGRR